MHQYLLFALLAFYALTGLAAFFAYWRDKRKAKKHRYRISELRLLSLGFFGGSVGALLGMQLFHHKTRHWYFWVVNVLGLLWQIGLLILLLRLCF